jgi:hypothetical protein
MLMRWWLGVSLAAVLAHSPAVAGDGLVMGLSEAQLLSCGQFLVGQMQRDGKTFYKFAQVLTNEGSKAVPAGLIGEQRDGCEASVGIENDRVATVETKQFSGSLLSCFACLRLFAECKYLRR